MTFFLYLEITSPIIMFRYREPGLNLKHLENRNIVNFSKEALTKFLNPISMLVFCHYAILGVMRDPYISAASFVKSKW